jgi:BioD-like phosphotransacetylase family protein
MITLCITSLSTGNGKTAICAGLGKQLQSTGKKTAYLKAVVGAALKDGDTVFMKESLSLQEATNLICPSFSNENQLEENIKKAFEVVANGKDVVIIECTAQSAAGVTRALSAKLIMVADYSEIANIPDVCKPLGVMGVIINKVPTSKVTLVRSETVSALKKANIMVFGIIPEDRVLLTFTIGEMAQIIDGQVLNNTEKASELVENIMLGALTVDSGPLYYERMVNKVAVIRADRSDMQMAALETSTRALVLAGNTPMILSVRNHAEDRKVTVVTTKLSVQAIADRIEEAVVKIRFNQKSKLPRLIELMAQGVDFTALYKACGIT